MSTSCSASLGHDVAASGQLGDEHALDVADQRRVDVRVGAGGLRDRGDVQPRLVREGAGADVRLLRVRRQVRQLRGEVRQLRQALELLVADDVDAELELEVHDHRDDVGVAAALAPAVETGLHLGRPGLHGEQRVRHREVGVVVDVDPYRAVDDAPCLAHAAHDRVGQRASVGVTERDGRRARARRRAQRREGVLWVVCVAVEEVLGVEDDLAALLGEEADRVGDHRQVLLLRRLEHVAHLDGGGFPDERHDRRLAREHGLEGRVARGLAADAAGRAEGDELGVLQPHVAHAREELRLLRIGAGVSALDVVDAELVELPDDRELVLDGEGEAFHPEAVAKGGVVEPDPFGLRLARHLRLPSCACSAAGSSTPRAVARSSFVVARVG